VMLKFLRAWAVVLALLLAGPALGAPVKTEAEAAKLAGQAVLRYYLTSLREECFVLDVEELKTYFDVGVRERHNAECGGNPEIAPKLFNVRVRKKDGRLTSDVYDGVTYKLMDHPRDSTK
jgi:hypothetical protein